VSGEVPDGGHGYGGTLGFDDALREMGEALAAHPEAAEAVWMRFASDCMAAGAATMANALRGGDGGPVMTPARADRRFKDPTWEQNPVYFGLQQGYLLWSRFMRDLVDAADLDRPTERKARFAVDAMIDALAPTNTLLGNPTALRKAVETGGQSVVKGVERFLDDVITNQGRPSQVDLSRFELGRDLAVTPGQVVFRNDLMELIQYAPSTRTVHAVPLLLSPPWINKYYVLDLSPGRSFIEWAVARGHTVFAMSYINPGSEHRDSGLDDYLGDGVLSALDVVCAITGSERVNVGGLCLGGTLAGAAAAYLAASGDHRVRSLTLLNTLLDFREPGVLGVFADDEAVGELDEMMSEKGYLDASAMARTFDALRANDLIWNYVASGWLMGEPPSQFDLLAWNADATRMPARMHGEYLRECYMENRLARGTMRLLGRRIRLDLVRADVYYVSAEDDHITPWKGCYASSRLFSGDVRFVLTSSGHIAGVVNPPGGKRTHRVDGGDTGDPDQWLAHSEQRPDSWWKDWAQWMRPRSGRRRPPPPMGSDDYPPLCPAPGTYVLQR
jgi:poly[(R)-3-hydroxyalkanoate] polymerase subunit PhaC